MLVARLDLRRRLLFGPGLGTGRCRRGRRCSHRRRGGDRCFGGREIRSRSKSGDAHEYDEQQPCPGWPRLGYEIVRVLTKSAPAFLGPARDEAAAGRAIPAELFGGAWHIRAIDLAVSNTHARTAPTADGACRRRPAGCAGRPASVALRAVAADRPRRWVISAAGREQHDAAARAERGAEIHVLRVHEIALVEQADGLGIRAPHQQAGAADPVDAARAPGRRAPRSARFRAAADRAPRRAPSAAARRAARSSGRTTAPRGRRRRRGAARRPRRPAARRARRPACRWRRAARSCPGSAAAPARRTSGGCRGCSRARTRRCRRRRARAPPGQRARAASAVPSGEALSTTTISWSSAGRCRVSDSRQASRCAREL